MSSERPWLVGSCVALLGLTGCPGSLDVPAAFEVDAGVSTSTSSTSSSTSCGDVPTGVLAPRCGISGCHGSPMSQAKLDLVSPNVYMRLVGKAAVGGPGMLID